MYQEQLSALRNVQGALTDAKDQAFAHSLLQQSERRMLSDKQMYWVKKLTERAQGKDKPATVHITTSVAEIVAMFDRAQHHLNVPKIRIMHGNDELRLHLAGERSSAPGSISVKQGDTWLGRILRTGMYQPARNIDAETVESVTATLRGFATDPAGTALAYGQATCRCCFCATPLRNDGSIEVGYGPICARNYGLPWSGKASNGAHKNVRQKPASGAGRAINSDLGFA